MRRFVFPLIVTASMTSPAISHADEPQTPSFLNEVMPLLTKTGCNQGACHGKGAGQNGFRLSLRGYAPDEDYKWITREFNGRRIDPAQPAASLLLLKATAQIPHGGGRVFAEGSREYQLLLRWIRSGFPGPDPLVAKVRKLELNPGDRVLQPGESVQLRATATFSDGTTRDVTWLTKFESNDTAYLDVSPDGRLTAVRNGASAVRAMFLTEVAVVTVSMPFDRPVEVKRFTEKNNFIDEHVFAKLHDLHIEPSDGCSDAEFIRRVFLDTCGILPTASEVQAFLADREPKKRAQLIDSLLTRSEFDDYWALQLGDLFQNRRERDHDVRGIKGVRQFHLWLRQQITEHRPWNELVRDVLTATGATNEHPAVGYFVVIIGEKRQPEQSEVGESVAQALLGTRIGCARCHNHPLERYTQDDFYHFAAYFSRVKLKRTDSKAGATVLSVSHPDPKQNAQPVGVNQPRTGMFMKAQPLDRTPHDVQPGDDPRVVLADWITDPKNTAFSGAMVNRIWQHYLGVGLVEPVDDLRATNPPTNPALWRALNQDFVTHQFDLRHLMRVILNSRTYQLSSTTRPGNESDHRFYSHYIARRLPAEVMLDAICQATDVPERFDGHPVGIRAVQVPDPGAASYFLRTFGRSDRVTACACERNGEVSLPQVLHLISGDATTAKVNNGSGWLAQALKTEKSDDRLLDALFLRTLSRIPTDTERARLQAILKDSPREEFFRDLLWAVLNSKDFLFNS